MIRVILPFFTLYLTSCTFTGKLWSEYNEIVKSEYYGGDSFSVAVLNKDEIAIFPTSQKNVRENKTFKDLATIYRFSESEYKSLKGQIKKVNIRERISISYKKRNITKVENSFRITLDNGSVLAPRYIDTTLSKRTENEMVFINNKIDLDRIVFIEGKNITDDYSFLYRVPLTPIAVTADIAKGVILTGVVVAGFPVMAVLCYIGPCN